MASCSDPHPAKKLLSPHKSPQPSLCFTAWEEELDDIDRDFILDVIDTSVNSIPVHCENHTSAKPGSTLYHQATEQVLREIQMGYYEVVPSPPEIISPLGVIPKPDGEVRLIHDCSQPPGKSVNDYCTTDWKQKFSRVDDAAALVTEGCYMAKCDLKSAYRSVRISEHSQRVTGFKWQFGSQIVYIKNKRLPFGSKVAPGIFHRLTQAVKRMLNRRGLKATVVYLDDFFIKADTLNDCAAALQILVQLLRKLGFQINWNKFVDPTTKITFLGIDIDSVNMTLRLPDESFIRCGKSASKKQLQSLAGKLNFCASVVYGGRVYSRRIIATLNALKADNHKIKLNDDILADISWW